jgi:hypothetical protein
MRQELGGRCLGPTSPVPVGRPSWHCSVMFVLVALAPEEVASGPFTTLLGCLVALVGLAFFCNADVRPITSR